jgi:hypothetical protein
MAQTNQKSSDGSQGTRQPCLKSDFDQNNDRHGHCMDLNVYFTQDKTTTLPVQHKT